MLGNKILLSIISGLLTSLTAFSQNGSIYGYVADADTKAPLQNVTVDIPMTSKGSFSNELGYFIISNVLPGSYELTVSHIGYKTEIFAVQVRANETARINATLLKAELDLKEITVAGRKSSTLNTIAAVDIKLRPVNTSQDVLRIVPGLFIAQHAGGGKAEQIFLRGYDIDHGTDINVTVDGMPVNMVSHAHGQGYSDLHFLIPETIEKVDFNYGPYNTEKGNQATAGWVAFQTKDFLSNNSLKVEGGAFGTKRGSALLKIFNTEKEMKREQLYVGSEYFLSDGYFQSPQDFKRMNALVKYSLILKNNAHLNILASHFKSRWDASGQIPERAVESGIIDRFGAFDDTEGGNTSRQNFYARFSKQWKNGWARADQLYFTNYDFSLYSNFTFFLNDSINGDGIRQKEKRNIYGYTGTLSKDWNIGKVSSRSNFGFGFRYDNIKEIELSKAVKRSFLSYLQRGAIKESNVFTYASQHFNFGNNLELTAGLRFDQFDFGYKNSLNNSSGFLTRSKNILSPKLNLTYAINENTRVFANAGSGFHSNDSRVVLNNVADKILPKVKGIDIGVMMKPAPGLITKVTAWHLYSEQEFVYVGDEGIVEAGGRARRYGFDFSARHQVTQWLFADFDINLSKARSVDAAKGEDYIPLSPSLTSIGGVTARTKEGLSVSLRYRFIKDRPANESGTVKADGYFITDFTANYNWKKLAFLISIENLFNKEWRDAQFDTESRLKNEMAPVSEIHFTPGTPRFLKAGVSYSF